MGKILVTGGTGYLGTHMLVELVKQGYEPLCVDNLHNSNPSVLLAVKEICGKEIPFIKADAGDVAAMRALFAEYQIDAVIHFAASGNETSFIRNVIRGSSFVLADWAKRSGTGIKIIQQKMAISHLFIHSVIILLY